MSIILKALKSTEGEGGKIKDAPVGGFFLEAAKEVKKEKPALPKLELGKGPPNKKRVYVLAGVLVVVLAVSFVLWKLNIKEREVITFQPEVAKPVEIVPVAPPPDPGQVAFAAGNYDKSISYYQDAVAKNPQDAMLHNNLGLSYLKKGMVKEAAAEFDKALVVDDSCAQCLNNYGMLRTETGDNEEARGYLEAAIGLEPGYPDPYFNLAILCEKDGDIGCAVKYYQGFAVNYPNKQDGLIDKVNQRIKFLSGK